MIDFSAFGRFQNSWPATRRAARGKPCPYCGEAMTRYSRRPSRDRIIPGRHGGTYAPENVIIVCSKCNEDRGAWSLSAFAAALAAENDPRAPIVSALIQNMGN